MQRQLFSNDFIDLTQEFLNVQLAEKMRIHRIQNLFPWAALVNFSSLKNDLLAGILGTLLVLPQGIAFATLAGLPVEYGLYSAVIPCIIGALFGSSWHVVTGPTNANSLALFAMLAPLATVGSAQYVELALAVTLMVGVIQFLVGILKFGSVANFISPTALLGFTSGAALLIALHALKDALGITESGVEDNFFLVVKNYMSEINLNAILVAALTLITSIWLRIRNRRLPFMLIGLCVGTIVSYFLNHFSIGKSVSVLGYLQSPIPPLGIPNINYETIQKLLGISFALSLVALAQSISIAKAVAEKSGQRINGNREFIGQGLANIFGGFFSSYVACGSLNRSMPNLESGAKTPLASVFSGILVIPFVVLASPLLAHIPYAAISGLLILVAWTLLDISRWRWLIKVSRNEFAIGLATLIATITLRLEVAILIGSALSLGAYLQRTSKPAMRTMGFDSFQENRQFVVVNDNINALPECPQLKLVRMEGAVYFGATAFVSDQLQKIRTEFPNQKHLLIMAKSMNFVDIAGSELWMRELRQRRNLGGGLYFHRPRPAVLNQWKQDGFIKDLGVDHIFPDKKTAIQEIFKKIDLKKCQDCKVRIFFECKNF